MKKSIRSKQSEWLECSKSKIGKLSDSELANCFRLRTSWRKLNKKEKFELISKTVSKRDLSDIQITSYPYGWLLCPFGK
jgi:hypothetical protein